PSDFDQVTGIANGTADGIKLINCISHDNTEEGINAFSQWTNTEIYGCLLYYNGRAFLSGNYAYGIYSQNTAPSTKLIQDNIIMNNYGNYPIHIYSGSGPLDNYTVTGNVIFGHLTGWALLGGGGTKISNLNFNGNYMYGPDPTMGILDVGYVLGAGSVNAKVQNNYILGGSVALNPTVSTGTVFSGNMYWGNPYDFSTGSFPSNTYLTPPTTPAGVMIFVRPNKYEQGRATVIVYNWNNSTTTSVDLSQSGLTLGQGYEVVDAQNYFGAPLASGVYNGGPISLPLNNSTVSAPISVPHGRTTPAQTSSQFNVFVVRPTS